MAELGEVLFDWLTTDAGVSAIVASRIFPLKLPQDTVLPAVTYQTVTGDREHSHSGPSGLSRPLVQVDGWTGTYHEAQALKRALVLALDGRGFGDVAAAFLESERDLYEDQTEDYRVSLDFGMWLREPVRSA